MERWLPGDSIVLRDIQCGRICAVVGSVVVEDSPSRLVTWTPDGSPLLLPADAEGRLVKSPEFHHLAELRWQAFGGPVYIWPAGEQFSIRVSWTGPDEARALDHWYVNLHSLLRRTPIGLDATDHVLDAVIQPDLQTWHWKDDAEFGAAVAAGRFTAGEAESIRAAGLRAVAMARAGGPPFDEGWERWRPRPGWAVPSLPAGWDVAPSGGDPP